MPSASTVHVRCRDFEYTARRPSPELAGSSSLGGGIVVVVVVVAGGGIVGVSWTCVPRVGPTVPDTWAGPGTSPPAVVVVVVVGRSSVVVVDGRIGRRA